MIGVFRVVTGVVFSIFGGVAVAMQNSDPCIIYQSSSGNLVKIRLTDVNEGMLYDMDSESLKRISFMVRCYQQFASRPVSKLSHNEKTHEEGLEGGSELSALRSSVRSAEAEFLSGINREPEFLDAGYKKLCDIASNTLALKKFDSNLLAIYANLPDTSLLRKLAERYKELALSSEKKGDFIKAAFWFRMLYASGEHSSYLEEYEDMCFKAGKL